MSQEDIGTAYLGDPVIPPGKRAGVEQPDAVHVVLILFMRMPEQKKAIQLVLSLIIKKISKKRKEHI